MAEYWNVDRLTEEWDSARAEPARSDEAISRWCRSRRVDDPTRRQPGARRRAVDGRSGERPLGRIAGLAQPALLDLRTEQQVERSMFGALVKMSDELVPTPDLARDDRRLGRRDVYTFTLREGMTFTDGTPLTSDDVHLHP